MSLPYIPKWNRKYELVSIAGGVLGDPVLNPWVISQCPSCLLVKCFEHYRIYKIWRLVIQWLGGGGGRVKEKMIRVSAFWMDLSWIVQPRFLRRFLCARHCAKLRGTKTIRQSSCHWGACNVLLCLWGHLSRERMPVLPYWVIKLSPWADIRGRRKVQT